MDRDIDGADVQVNNTLSLTLREIGKGDVVAHQKAEPCVIILEIHGAAHTPGQLVNKAEDTAVGAGAGCIHQVAFKVQAQIAALRLFHTDCVLAAIRAAQHDIKLAVIGKELIIQHIVDFIAIDGNDSVAQGDLAFKRAGGVHRLYEIIFHGAGPLSNDKK